MTEIPIPDREARALREVGRTAVSATVARLLAGALLLTVAAVPLIQGIADWRQPEERVLPRLRQLLGAVPEAWTVARAEGPLAANRGLLAAIAAFEDRLDEESLLRERLLPPTQELLAASLGLGNEKAWPGREGWLFYVPDVAYATTAGFLEPGVLTRRARGGDAWERAPRPDPLPALSEFREQLAARGIELLVVPTPVKPLIHPERLAAGAAGLTAPPQNPSFDELLARLGAAGIAVFDPAPLLWAAARESGEPQYLATDTHWTPAAMERVAAELAARSEALAPLAEPGEETGFFRRSAEIAGEGDIAKMLRLPEGSGLFGSERVTVAPVLDLAGGAWSPDPAAEVLLLGDSFTNVYSEAALGWGAGAGLAEQLAYRLQRPVDRIALNAGGSHATREALARALAGGDDRLAGKRVVIYQFAVRELSQGDWKRVALPEPPA